jgi:hypothetical protein
MNYFSILSFCLLALFSTVCVAEKKQSLLTSVEDNQCQPLVLEAAHHRIAKGVEFVAKCKGAKGYHIYLVDDGSRSWYVLQHPKGLHSFEEQIVYQQHIKGNFPNVGASGSIEWLIKANGKVLGLIFSVNSQLIDDKTGRLKNITSYFSIRLDQSDPYLVGVKSTLHQAKMLLRK